MKKNKVSYMISICLLVISLSFIIYSAYQIIYSKNETKKTLEQWHNLKKGKVNRSDKDDATSVDNKDIFSAKDSESNNILLAADKEIFIDKDDGSNKNDVLLVTNKDIFPAQYETKPQESEVIGKLTIHRTNKDIPLIEGTSKSDLKKGAGRYIESFLPGKNGNCIIFGHRDGVFSSLEDIKLDDVIVIQTLAGEFIYKIVDTKITEPSEEEIIKVYDEPVLTLVTCYPFGYIGSAPKRFIVTASLEI